MTTPSNPNESPFFEGVHKEPPSTPFEGMSQDQIRGLRERLITSIIQIVVQAITGIFTPGGGLGGAVGQLTSWATSVFSTAADALSNWTSLFSGLPGLSNIGDFLGWIFPTTSGSGIFSRLISGVTGGTNPLSTLISSFLGTASTASTANTNANTGLSNWTTLLAGLPGVSTISNFISWLTPSGGGTGVFANLISGVSGGTFSTLISSLTGTASTNASTANTGIGSILDNIFGGLTKFTGNTGISQTQAREALDGTSSALITTNATVEQILAALGPGNVDADDFERTGSTPGGSWDLYSTGTGTVGTPNGHDLAVGGSADFEFVMRRNTGVADDDSMISSIVLGTTPETSPFLFPSEFGCNDVWIRMSTFTTWATRTGVRLRYQADKTLRVDCFVSGTQTTIMSPVTIPPPSAGASLTIESVGATRVFNIRCGGYSAVVTEAGSASQVGASYRGRGLGGKTENTLLATAHPGTFKQWTGQG